MHKVTKKQSASCKDRWTLTLKGTEFHPKNISTCEHKFEYWVTRVRYNMVSELDLCFLLKDSEGLIIGERELLYVTEGTHFWISNSKITRFLSGLPLVRFVCLFDISWKVDLFLSRCSSTSLAAWKWSLQGSPGDHHWLGFLCKEVCAPLWRFWDFS